MWEKVKDMETHEAGLNSVRWEFPPENKETLGQETRKAINKKSSQKVEGDRNLPTAGAQSRGSPKKR